MFAQRSGLSPKKVMRLRQSGIERSELEAAAREFPVNSERSADLVLSLIDTAYEGWEIAPEGERERVALEFREAWTSGCLIESAPRSEIRLRDPEDY